MITPNFIASPWCEFEVSLARRTRRFVCASRDQCGASGFDGDGFDFVDDWGACEALGSGSAEPSPPADCVIFTSPGICGGTPFAFTIAQCHSWSGKSTKFKGVRKIAIADGAADPFTCNNSVTSGCFSSESWV